MYMQYSQQFLGSSFSHEIENPQNGPMLAWANIMADIERANARPFIWPLGECVQGCVRGIRYDGRVL